MKPTTLTLLAFAASVRGVSKQLINNFCDEGIFVTIYTNHTLSTNGPFELPGGQAYTSDIISTGNTATITKTSDVFQEIPKLVLGTSTDQGVLYWAVSNLTGDPFVNESFSIMSHFNNATGPNFCQNATTYDGLVHACPDANVTLALNLC